MKKTTLWKCPKQQVLISTMDSFIFAPKSVTEPLMKDLKLVPDNRAFKAGRILGNSGLDPKDVLIKCPEQEVMDKLPIFEFKFGTQTFTLTPKEYILGLDMPLDNVFNWCHIMIREKPKDGMYAKFVMPENNTDQWVFGQLFFNKACVAFKYGETPQLALAPPKAIANPSH
ncbi:hypothetical protein niasHT_014456 [Heterodera trifolii]|uniref:Peptidase A1 domain-containing protein n=1 Tax=Heterodera trifolii TaxID=157864 RepID=A0ABD2KZA2_9BILA